MASPRDWRINHLAPKEHVYDSVLSSLSSTARLQQTTPLHTDPLGVRVETNSSFSHNYVPSSTPWKPATPLADSYPDYHRSREGVRELWEREFKLESKPSVVPPTGINDDTHPRNFKSQLSLDNAGRFTRTAERLQELNKPTDRLFQENFGPKSPPKELPKVSQLGEMLVREEEPYKTAIYRNPASHGPLSNLNLGAIESLSPTVLLQYDGERTKNYFSDNRSPPQRQQNSNFITAFSPRNAHGIPSEPLKEVDRHVDSLRAQEQTTYVSDRLQAARDRANQVALETAEEREREMEKIERERQDQRRMSSEIMERIREAEARDPHPAFERNPIASSTQHHDTQYSASQQDSVSSSLHYAQKSPVQAVDPASSHVPIGLSSKGQSQSQNQSQSQSVVKTSAPPSTTSHPTTSFVPTTFIKPSPTHSQPVSTSSASKPLLSSAPQEPAWMKKANEIRDMGNPYQNGPVKGRLQEQLAAVKQGSQDLVGLMQQVDASNPDHAAALRSTIAHAGPDQQFHLQHR